MLISDWAEGKAAQEQFQFTWYFLINPAWSCVIKDGDCILTCGAQKVRIEDVSGIGLAIVEGFYCPAYQVESFCPALTATCRAMIEEKTNLRIRY